MRAAPSPIAGAKMRVPLQGVHDRRHLQHRLLYTGTAWTRLFLSSDSPVERRGDVRGVYTPKYRVWLRVPAPVFLRRRMVLAVRPLPPGHFAFTRSCGHLPSTPRPTRIRTRHLAAPTTFSRARTGTAPGTQAAVLPFTLHRPAFFIKSDGMALSAHVGPRVTDCGRRRTRGGRGDRAVGGRRRMPQFLASLRLQALKQHLAPHSHASNLRTS